MIPDDFELMAYVDGELDAQSSKRVAEAVEADPALQAKVDALITSRDVAKAAYAPAEAAPLSSALSETLATLEQELQAPERDIAALSPEQISSGGAGMISWVQDRFAVMIGLGFAGGALAAWTMMSQLQPEPFLILTETNDVTLSGHAQQLLSETPSGRAIDGVSVQTSFRSDDGRACRQFTLSNQAGIACLDQQVWTLIILTDAPSNTEFQAAGGSDALAVATANLGVSKVLSADEEAALIENEWQPLVD